MLLNTRTQQGKDEEKKHKLPHDVWSSELDTIERLLRSQNLEIYDGEIREIKEVKPKFKVGQYVIYQYECFYIHKMENRCYYLVGISKVTHVEIPFEKEDELTLIPIGAGTLPPDIYGKLLNELYTDFPEVPPINMLRIVQRTKEYVESQPK